jgi:hypothetical protein
MAKNPLDGGASSSADDPKNIKNMPGYVPPAQRKEWTLEQHCEFANRQLEHQGINKGRYSKGFGPVRWVIHNGRVELATA